MRNLILSLLLLLGLNTVTFAAPPVLSEIANSPLRDSYRAGEPYTIRLEYRDKEGDSPKKSEFVDEGPSGKVSRDAKVIGTDYTSGVTLEWDVTGFEQGRHTAYFLIRDSSGAETRYTRNAGPNGFWTFVAESLWLKVGIVALGALVGMLFVPFVIYLLARSLNRNGDPSTAARVGLLFGIIAVVALAIQQFAGFFPPILVWGVSIFLAITLLLVIFTRR